MKKLLILSLIIGLPFTSNAALVRGTNYGFVLVAPTTDPQSPNSPSTMDGRARCQLDTSPADATSASEIGFYNPTNNSANSSDFAVNIYSNNAGRPNAFVGTTATDSNVSWTANWHKISCSISISGSTDYWSAAQVDAATGTTRIEIVGDTGNWYEYKSTAALPNPWDGSAGDANYSMGIYTVYTTAAPSGAPQVILISQVYNPIFGCNVLGF